MNTPLRAATIALALSTACLCQATTVLLVVEEPGSLDPQDAARRDDFEAWGFTVILVDDSASQSTYDSLFSSADVVYVSENANSSDIGFKLRTSPIGVVSEHGQLDDEMGFTNANSGNQDASSIQVVDNSHPITSGFPIGSVSVTSSNQTFVHADGTVASGATILANLSGNESLFVLETGAALANTESGNSTASGPRVRLPWGESSFDWGSLNINGVVIAERALEWAAGGSQSRLVGHWRLDETSGTTAIDSSAAGNDGSLVDSPARITDGLLGGAVSLSSSQDRISLPSNTIDRATNVTFATWFRTTQGTGDYTIISGANSSLANEFHVELFDNNQISASTGESSGTTVVDWLNLPPFDDGRWHHLVVIRDQTNGQMELYLDGVSYGAQATTLNVLEIDPNGLVLGEDQDSVGGSFDSSEAFEGDLDEIHLFRTALDAAEVAQLYGLIGHWKLDETSGTTANDSSLLNNPCLYRNGIILGDTGPYPRPATSAVTFDGVDDFIQTDDSVSESDYDVTDAISVACWVRPETTVRPSATLVSKGLDTWRLAMTDAADRPSFACSGLSTAEVVANTPINDEQWHHVVGIYDGAELRIYVDGRLDNSTPATGQIDTNDFRLQIGERGSGTHQFEGSMYDVRVYNRAITHQEVSDIYGLIGHWAFDEQTGSTIADSTGLANDARFNIGVPQWISRQVDGALSFDGASDAVTDAAFEPPSTGAVAFWFRSAGPPAATQRLWGIRDNFEMWQAPDGLLVMDLLGDGLVGDILTTTPLHTNGRWYHVIAQYDTNDEAYEIYIDGLLHRTGSATVDLFDEAAGLLSFGTRTGITDWFTGALDDFRIYNRWLTPLEAKDLFSSGFTPGVRIRQWVEVR